MRTGSILLAGCLCALNALAAPSGSESGSPGTIVFGMTPVVGVEATLERFSRLSDYLSSELGIGVRLQVTASYGQLIEQLASGQVDLAKISPLAYVRAKRRIKDLTLIATHVANGSVTYSSYLVGLQEGPHTAVDRLKGARICFADPDSTSGYLYPLAFLNERGLEPGRDLVASFAGDHRSCLEGLFAGQYDLVATWAGAIRDARQSGLDVGELAIVAKTGRIPYDAYCVRPGLDKRLTGRIQSLLLGIHTMSREGRRVLAPTLGINGWVVGNDQVYDGIREVENRVRKKLSEQPPDTP